MFHKKLLLGISLFFLFLTNSVLSQPVTGTTPVTSLTTLSLPEQPMHEALRLVSQHYQIQLVYSSNLVTGLTSHPVSDAPSITDALMQLFSQSDLSYDFIDEQALLIFKQKKKRKINPVVIAPSSLIDEIDIAPAVPVEFVLVTGSRLRRNQYDTPFPTQIISDDIVNNDVHRTLSDALNSQPALCEPRFSLNTFNANNIGESFGDLYCLGSQRTLSLINGRRSVSTNEPALPNAEPGLQVDLNMLPRLMVKSIEIIGVGGAPVYGSDAIAGTVNVLLHDDFEGVKLDLQTGFADQTGGEQINIGGLFGTRLLNERLSLVASYEFHKQKALYARDRFFTRSNFEYVGITPDPTQVSSTDILFTDRATNPLVTRSGIPTPNGDDFPLFAIGENRFTNNQGDTLSFNSQGRLSPFNLGELTLDLDRTIGGDGIQAQSNQFIQLPTERHAFALNTRFDITPFITAFSELQVYSAHFESRGTGFEVVASLDTPQDPNTELSINENFNSLPVSTNYAFLHPDDAAYFNRTLPNTGVNTFYLHKDWNSLIDPTINVNSHIARAVLGLEGQFDMLSREFSWDIVANYGRSSSTTTSNRLNRLNFNQALNSTLDPNSNIPVCTDNSNGCVPLNVLGESQDPDSIRFVTQRFDERGELEQNMITANIQTHLLTLNGGDLRFLVGGEARKETAIYSPPINYQEPRLPISNEDISLIADLNNQRINSFSTSEIFVELLAPVLGDTVISGLEKLELEANWRGVNHSITGKDDVWTTALRLTLNPHWIKGRTILRSNITQSIRSPTLLELASPLTPTITNVNDPCDKDFVNSGNSNETTSKRSICSNQATLSGFSYNNQTFESQVPRLAPLSLEGTPTLENEQARSKTAGLVYQSSNDYAFNLSMDYININVNNAIVLRDIQNTLDECYTSFSGTTCNDIVRISDFQLFGVRNAYQNIGQISLTAWQYAMELTLDAHAMYAALAGEFTFNLNAYELKEYLVDEPGGAQDQTGQLRFPEWQANLSLNYQHEDISVRWTTLFTHNTNIQTSRSAANNMPAISDYQQHSLYIDYAFTSSMRVALGIENVFDAQPPQGLPSDQGGSTYDINGRYFNLGLKLDF